ncbi:MAG: DUF3313 domain-containing protein [Gammaproteobacteria bacterium]|nr:DUF3313 domain-containing protein [Gammaproteobacteria bacterium]
MLPRRFSWLAATVLALAACTSTPTVQRGPEAEVTFDGLTRVDNTAFNAVWVRSGADLDGYDKVMLQSAGLEFRDVGNAPVSGSVSSRTRRSSDSEFRISEEDQERLRKTVGEAFRIALSGSDRFELVDEPGPGVLLVRGALMDVVSNVPPEPIGRGRIFLDRVGEATLVIEIRDAQTKQIYVRAVDRRAAERQGQQLIQANSVSTWAEVRRLANRWANQLRRGLDELLTLETIPD